MQTTHPSFLKLSTVVLALLAAQALPVSGQQVEDWTHHRLVFSNPGGANEAAAHGKFVEWSAVTHSHRFKQQEIRRSFGTKSFIDDGRGQVRAFPPNLKKPAAIHKDWSEPLLTGGEIQPNTYPAKFSFDTTTASCANDYIAYPTGVAGTTTTGSVVAYNNLYVGTGGCAATLPTIDWVYDTGAMVTTSPVLSLDGTQLAFIQSTATASSLVLLSPGPNQAGKAVTAGITNGSATITFASGALTQAYVGMHITGTGIPANDTIATIVSATSATLAANATATNAAAALTVVTESLTAPAVLPTNTTAAAFAAGCAPCMYTVALSGPALDTFSAPYYDYASDSLFVGDNTGHLHKFTGIFNGTPSADTSVLLTGATTNLTSPVYDQTSGCVFVGGITGVLFSVNSGIPGGTVCTAAFGSFGHSQTLANAATAGIYDAPIVDSAAQKVYVFVTASANITPCVTNSNCVFQFATTTITSGSTTAAPTDEAALGVGAAPYFLYDGTFDNVYYSSVGGSAGNLWSVANTDNQTLAAEGANLYQVPITGATSAVGTPVVAVARFTVHATATRPFPSPVTEFCNNGLNPCTSNGTITTAGVDRIYFSVGELQTTTGACTTGNVANGCVLAYTVTNPAAPTISGEDATVTAATNGCWSTGGIVVDNSVPSATQVGASEIYWFALNGNGAGGPTLNTFTSTGCTNVVTHVPNAIQDLQTL